LANARENRGGIGVVKVSTVSNEYVRVLVLHGLTRDAVDRLVQHAAVRPTEDTVAVLLQANECVSCVKKIIKFKLNRMKSLDKKVCMKESS
jgi:hypothetical protein